MIVASSAMSKVYNFNINLGRIGFIAVVYEEKTARVEAIIVEGAYNFGKTTEFANYSWNMMRQHALTVMQIVSQSRYERFMF
jgi:hypothetical protein